MAVAVILVLVPSIRLGRIVTALRAGFGGQNGRSLFQTQAHLTFQVDGKAQISSCRKSHLASAFRSGCDGAVDRWCVHGLAVSPRAKLPDVENRCEGRRGILAGLPWPTVSGARRLPRQK